MPPKTASDPFTVVLDQLEAIKSERITGTGVACLDAAILLVRLAEDASSDSAREKLLAQARGWVTSAVSADQHGKTREVAAAIAKLEAKREQKAKLRALK